ncbi:MAG: DUF4169 family protein [Alphaproteobacteria bacterium]|nr:DUF4169 family protein [Alphaproteobacteria bacterium]
MAEIVNLKRARKAKARDAAAANAAENRATHGQTKAERARLALEHVAFTWVHATRSR